MVMATGELEYDSIFGHSNESSSLLTSFPVVAYILWIIFLIVMPILLTNLLVREGMYILRILDRLCSYYVICNYAKHAVHLFYIKVLGKAQGFL